MTWGGRQNDEKDAHEQLSYALDAGINFIDTAEVRSIDSCHCLTAELLTLSVLSVLSQSE